MEVINRAVINRAMGAYQHLSLIMVTVAQVDNLPTCLMANNKTGTMGRVAVTVMVTTGKLADDGRENVKRCQKQL